MTRRALLAILCAVIVLLCALSTRGAIFWLIFWILSLMLLLGLASVLWTRLTLTLSCQLDKDRVVREERVNLSLLLRHRCLLPIAALRLDVCALDQQETFTLYASVQPMVDNTMVYALYCPHVGSYPAGVAGVRVQDVFGLFSFHRRYGANRQELLVLPSLYSTPPLAFSPGDSDNESAMARAFEDATMPTDLRTFQQGDELKKVHWKLSMRKREMIVRVYEQPMRPDALLLLDCSPPEGPGYAISALRDALCEAAASVASAALRDGAPVRMPLLTDTPVDINASRPEDIESIRDALARCPFDGAQEFERVLLLETRRMRRTGTTAIFTSKLNPTIADMILRIRRMGPKVRVHLAADAEAEGNDLLTGRLMRNDVEVHPIEVKRVFVTDAP